MAELSNSNENSEGLGIDSLDYKDDYVTVFVPSITRDGDSLDHEYWCNEAIRILSKLFGGATAIKGLGGWLDIEQERKIKQEPISMVFSFMKTSDWNKETVLELRKFLHRMGREAKQGEIGLVKFGKYIPITRYDDE